MVLLFIRYVRKVNGHSSNFFFSFESIPFRGFNRLSLDIAPKNTKNYIGDSGPDF